MKPYAALVAAVISLAAVQADAQSERTMKPITVPICRLPDGSKAMGARCTKEQPKPIDQSSSEADRARKERQTQDDARRMQEQLESAEQQQRVNDPYGLGGPQK